MGVWNSTGESRFPHLRFHVGNGYDDLSRDAVISLEVVEHCCDSRSFAKTFLSLIAPGGIGFLSTPYKGYLKNLVLAVTGKMDAHYTALWEGGHIKFFLPDTLRRLLRESGANDLNIIRVGRISVFAKSMIAIVRDCAEKPAT